MIRLSDDQLRAALRDVRPEDSHPLIVTDGEDLDDGGGIDETSRLPLVIKEGDVRRVWDAKSASVQ